MKELQDIYKCPIFIGKQILRLSKEIESFTDILFIYSLRCHGLPYPKIGKALYLKQTIMLPYVFKFINNSIYYYIQMPDEYYISCCFYPEIIDVLFSKIPEKYRLLYMNVLSDYLDINMSFLYSYIDNILSQFDKLDNKLSLNITKFIKKILYFFIDKNLYFSYITNIKSIIRKFK